LSGGAGRADHRRPRGPAHRVLAGTNRGPVGDLSPPGTAPADQRLRVRPPARPLPLRGSVSPRRPRERAAQLMLAAGALFVTGMVSSPYGPRVIDLTG